MKVNMKSACQKTLAVTLALWALVFVPMTALADVAGAAGPVGLPAIAIGGDNGDGSTASSSPTEVGFNGKGWQVIGYDRTGVASAANDMTLLLKDGESYGTAKFNSANDGVNYSYYDSTYGELYLKMADIYDTSPLGEKALIQARAIDAKDNDVGTQSVPNQRFWPLSRLEASAVNDDVLIFSDDWWLRSPGLAAVFAACVEAGGIVNGNTVSFSFAVRPAFNLNLSSVLFTSDANAAGAAGLSGLAAYTVPAGALKFTALDSTFSSGFAITETAASGEPGATVTLNYTGAVAGASNFIRVKLVKDTAPGQIAYVAVPVSNIAAAGGSFALALPSGMPMGSYTAYVWVEEGNGANLTNRGSVPDEFALTIQPSVTFSPSSGSINLSNPTNLVFQAGAPALLSGYAFAGVAFQNVTTGTGFGRALDSSDGVTYNPATGVLTVPAAAFGQHASIGGGNPLTPGAYRARITFWDGASLYRDYYADFAITGAPTPPSYGVGGNPPAPITPVAEASKPAFPASGQVVGRRINVYKYETLKTVLFRMSKDDEFTILGLANNGRVFHIEKDGREGYIAMKDIKSTFGAAIKATALKKAGAYIKLESGKLKRIGYYPKEQTLWIHGISGKYLINKQTSVTYYLDAAQWKLWLP